MGKPIAQFPSRDELSEFASQPAQVTQELKVVEVDRWQIQTSVPAVGAAYPSENEWDARLVAAASGKPGRASPELRCAATEAARFFAQNAGHPEDGLRRFLIGRCGSTLGSFNYETLTLEVPDSVPDAEVAKSLAKGADELIARHAGKGQELGLGFARGNGRAALIAYFGVPSGKLSGFSPLIQGNAVTLSGELAPGVEQVLGFVNQAEFGVQLCEPDRAVRLPAFRMSCPVAEGDETARLEVASRRANQVLMSVNLQVLARRSDEAGLTYETNKQPTAAAANAAQFEQSLFEALNSAREKAGVRRLTLEKMQSQTNGKLVPHFFAHLFSGNQEAVDTIGLGLMAGWDVGGTIRDGGIFSGWVATSRNPGRWLSYALESPLGRWVLLESSMSRVAVGAAGLQPSGAVAVVTTYSFFESTDHKADETAVFNELNKVRAARGFAPLRRAANSSAVQSALARVALNSATTTEAMQEAMERVVREQQRSVQGWVLETSDLKHLLFADALLAPGSFDVEIGVTHYKAPGGAWAQYAVLFMIYDAGPPTQTAKATGPGPG